MTGEYKPVVTYDETGKALVETVCYINHPAGYSFETVNDFIHGHDRTFEEMQSLRLGMAAHIEKLENVKNDGDDEKSTGTHSLFPEFIKTPDTNVMHLHILVTKTMLLL